LIPAMNAVGMKTELSTRVIAITGPVISSSALIVASRGGRPFAIQRSTFSTTTIASSTTMPMASTRPKSDRLFSEKPSKAMTKKVPIRETRDVPALAGLHDDVSELVRVEEPAERVDGVLEVDADRGRRLTDASGRDLHVLLAERLQDVGGGHAARGERGRVEPDPHAVVARAEEADVAHPRQPGERVLHLDGGVVAEVELVVAPVGREEIHAEEDHRRLLLHRDALALHLLRQLRLGDRDPVLGEHLREVEVRP